METQRPIAFLLSCLLFPLLVCGCSTQRSKVVASFGPVRERVLPFGVPCSLYFFQFDNGEVFISGHGPDTTKEEAEKDQKAIDGAGGVDLCAFGDETGFQLVGAGSLFSRDLRGLSWEKTTAEEVIARMKQVDFVEQAKPKDHPDPFAAATGGGIGLLEPKTKDLPMVSLFKTARGEVGVMEVLEVVADKRGHSGDGKGRGIKFRYKLVQHSK